MGSKVRCGDSLQAGSESDAGSRKWGTYTPTSLPQSQLVSQTLPTLASPQSSFPAPPASFLLLFTHLFPFLFFWVCLPSPWRCLRHSRVVKEKKTTFNRSKRDQLTCKIIYHALQQSKGSVHVVQHIVQLNKPETLRPKSLGGFKL